MPPREAAEAAGSAEPTKADGWQPCLHGTCVLGGAPLPQRGGLSRPLVLPQCLAQCWPVYLELFELTFHIYFQGGEHGLVLEGQVLESVQATLTVTL